MHEQDQQQAEPQAAVPEAAPGAAPVSPLAAGPMTPERLVALQRSAGNAAVSGLLGGADEAVRARTEAATGFDLSGARITRSSPAADALGVDGLTVGHDVHLGSAAPPAGTAQGDHVLSHELAHVVQQATGSADLAAPGRADALEHDAERTAERAGTATAPASLRPLPVAAAPVAQAYDPRYHRRALVHGLQGTGFADEDIGRIYAANWERDMSQAHPALAAAALRWKEIKMAAVEGERPLEPRIQAFNASVDHLLELGTLLNITSGEAYGGYRFYEHMDNPGAEPMLDPSKAQTGFDRALRQAHRDMMYQDAGGIPQYMADGRDYVKAQLVRAAEAYKGSSFSGTSAAGQTRDAWARREEQLRDIVGHDPDRPIIEGQDPDTAVIAKETAHQAAELAAAGPGADYDGERVTPPVPAPGGTTAPPAAEEAPPPTGERKPLSGPVFNTEVDRRFWAQNPERAGQRLDPKNPEDGPYVQRWLQLRDQVRAEWAAANEARAQALAEQERRRAEAAQAANQEAAPSSSSDGAEPAATPHAADLPPAAADALGRASHSLEDFWSHSNFIELALGIRLQDVNPGSAPLTGAPGDVNTTLQTSTFSGTDSSHSLSHKIRAIADEIEAEVPLVNRVTGKTTEDPTPDQIGRIGSEAPVTDTHEHGESIDEAREHDPTMQDAEGRVRDSAIGGGIAGGLLGGLAGAGLGFLVGGPIGAIVGGVGGLIGGGLFGAFQGAQSGIKEAGREVIATPAGVALLRRLAEGMEEETRANQEEGGHSQIAKDQPGHEAGDPLNDLRTFRFEVSQECAGRADHDVIGGMRRVLDAPPDRIDAEMQALLELVDRLIGPPAGHPYEAMVHRHAQRAEDLMTALAASRAGGGAAPAPEPAGHAH